MNRECIGIAAYQVAFIWVLDSVSRFKISGVNDVDKQHHRCYVRRPAPPRPKRDFIKVKDEGQQERSYEHVLYSGSALRQSE